uniref:Uncharacterized protein n=1 Tax=Anguilla anguilla TaxID=7936 RepID=A0A0E9UBD2_ANGAN
MSVRFVCFTVFPCPSITFTQIQCLVHSGKVIELDRQFRVYLRSACNV